MPADRQIRLARLVRILERREAVAERAEAAAARRIASLQAEKTRLEKALTDSRTAHADVVIPVASTRLHRLEPKIEAARVRRDQAAAARRREALKRVAAERRSAEMRRADADRAERAALEALALLHLVGDDSLG